MSLVGPRPLILDEHAHVDGWGLKRLELKPGITGLWQVLGRDDIPFSEMVELDYRYVTGWSLWSDVKLLFRTIPVLLRQAAGRMSSAVEIAPGTTRAPRRRSSACAASRARSTTPWKA